MSGYTKKIIKYAVLPGLVPRLKELFGSGFTYLSLFMAYIYRDLGLLPSNHPYFHRENAGRFGVRHVMSEAWRNLSFKRENIDQVIIFFAMLMGLVLMVAQAVLFVGAMLIEAAEAAGIGCSTSADSGIFNLGIFRTPDATDDIALNMLDRIFGIPGILESCGTKTKVAAMSQGHFTDASVTISQWPSAFHNGMHAMFGFYNSGVLVLAFVIFLYYVWAIVAETAQSGTPFGQRFNRAWAPIRFILAIALLTPLLFGFNGAQLVALQLAKAGSGLATNSLNLFVEATNKAPAGANSILVARPHPPPVSTLVESVFLARVCAYTQLFLYDRGTVLGRNVYRSDIKPYLVKGGEHEKLEIAMPYDAALQFYKNGDVSVYFGYPVPEGSSRGGIDPVCGSLLFETQILNEESNPGGYYIASCYFSFINEMFYNQDIDSLAQNLARRAVSNNYRDPNAPLPPTTHSLMNSKVIENQKPIKSLNTYIDKLLLNYFNNRLTEKMYDQQDSGVQIQHECSDMINVARQKQAEKAKWDDELALYGWGGAGIYYNKIAEINGSLIQALYNMPTMTQMPATMEAIAKAKRAESPDVTGDDLYNPSLGDRLVRLEDPRMLEEGNALHTAKTLFVDSYPAVSGNMFTDTIGFLFGLQGLFDLRNNADVNPLAQFSAIGRGLIDSTIQNLGGWALTSIVGLAAEKQSPTKEILSTLSSFTTQVMMLGLTIGFTMYYVLPMLPFVYFFFAVARWVKGLFEAMIGLPLWALAHMRIDGEGIPGQMAVGGYFLLLEILVRPVMIVMGLLAGIAVFSAQAIILNDIFDLVIDNLTGHGEEVPEDGDLMSNLTNIVFWRSNVDMLFYTIIYAVVIYMAAMSSFKMVDQIPNHILRFMGANVSSFADNDEDPAENLIKRMNVAFNQAQGSMSALTSSQLLR
jgi:conjugal transfer/type IV secretion protein DotA/TraY